jgi:hypothetical protein
VPAVYLVLGDVDGLEKVELRQHLLVLGDIKKDAAPALLRNGQRTPSRLYLLN